MEPSRMEQTVVSTRATGASRTCVVILDAGEHAWLDSIDGAKPIGYRFQRRGITWVITGYRQHVNAFVAEPVEH